MSSERAETQRSEEYHEASSVGSIDVVLLLAGNALAQTSEQATRPDPLGDLNSLFLKEYVARMEAINQKYPLYIEVSGDDLVLHRNGQEESKRVIPEIYDRLKEVSHVPFLLYLRLEPLLSVPQLSENDIAGLRTLSAKISAARDAVSGYPTYRKPFDMIFERAKTGEWWALVDDLRTLPPGQIVAGPLLRLDIESTFLLVRGVPLK